MDLQKHVAWACFVVGILLSLAPPGFSQSSSDQVLWRSGTEGYHTYRIPSLLLTQQGRLLAFCEGRKTGRGDHGDIDLLIKTSNDGGISWSPHRIVHEEGGQQEITIGNPCPVVDRSTKMIWLSFTRNNRSVWIMSSRDDGETWSKPRDLSSSCTGKDWTWVATGPGVGIQLQGKEYRDRLVIPCDHRVKLPDGSIQENSHMMFSDDHGVTWRLSQPIQPGGNECQVVELTDGSLIVNMRMQGNYQGLRGTAVSRDGGEHWTAIVHDSNLPCPKCQASLMRLQSGELLFCNPFPGLSQGKAKGERVHLTARLSRDEGRTWQPSIRIHDGPSAYSSLAQLPNREIVCLFEAGERSPYETLTLKRWNPDVPANTKGPKSDP